MQFIGWKYICTFSLSPAMKIWVGKCFFQFKILSMNSLFAFISDLIPNLWSYTTHSWYLCSYSLNPLFFFFLKLHLSLWRRIMVSSICEEHRFSLCLKCFFQNACQAVSSNLSYAITFSTFITSVAACLAHFVFKRVVETVISSVSWMLLTVKMHLLLYFCI